MCRPASMIVTKDRVFWSKATESHHEIRNEFGLPDNTANRTYNVQVEIVPTDGDLTLPFRSWEFRVDQDRLPKWWDAEQAETMCRAALKAWRKAKVVMPGKVRDKVAAGEHAYVYGTVREVCGTVQEVNSGGTVQAVYGTVQAVNSGGTVIAYAKLPNITLHGPNAVLIDRSGDTPKMRTGK